METNLRHSIFLEIILKVSFCLLVCPFAITWNKKKELQIKQYYLHKCLSAIVGLLSMCGILMKLKDDMMRGVNNPARCFQFCSIMIITMTSIVAYKSFWTKQTSFRDVIKISQSISHHLSSLKMKWLIIFAATTVCLVEISRAFLLFADSLITSVPLDKLSWKNGMRYFVQKGQFTFLLSNTSKQNFSQTEEPTLSPTDICIGVLWGLMDFTSLILGPCVTSFCTMSVLTLWSAVADFCRVSLRKLTEISQMTFVVPTCNNGPSGKAQINTIKVDSEYSHHEENFFHELCESYVLLKSLAKNINEAIGEIIFFYPFIICFESVTAIGIVFSSIGWRLKICWHMSTIQTFLLMTLSADVCRKMETLKLRIAEEQFNHQIFARKDFKNLFSDMSMRHVSISGMGVFTIDFSFCFIVMSTTITYFLVVLGQT